MYKNKYKDYKAVDFLKDEDFLRWNFFKQEEDEVHWIRVANEYPELRPVLDEAVKLFHSQVRLNDYSLESERIESSYISFKRKVERRKRWRATA